jgi:hypothetical protein
LAALGTGCGGAVRVVYSPTPAAKNSVKLFWLTHSMLSFIDAGSTWH